MITCRELIDFLYGYVSHELPSEELTKFEEHLAVCPSCVNYIQNYRSVIRLGKLAMSAPDSKAPEEVPEDLIQAILKAHPKPKP